MFTQIVMRARVPPLSIPRDVQGDVVRVGPEQ
jgi:hypothetical protein